MLKRWPLSIALLASIASSAPSSSSPKTGGSALLAFFTGLQSSQLTAKNAKTILAPIVALHVLEHLVCGNSTLGRRLTGTTTDANNPHQKQTLAFYAVVKALYHIIPSLLSGANLTTGIKSFINSGHLARIALVTPFRIQDKKSYVVSRLASILLIANQCRMVNTVHSKVIEECKELGIEDPFTKAMSEPSHTHIKLPRYLTQDFGVFLAQWFTHRIVYENHCHHFNKEFWAPNERFWPTRQFNAQLLVEFNPPRANHSAMLTRLVSPLLEGAGKLGSATFGTVASLLGNLFLVLLERSKDKDAIPGKTSPEVIKKVLLKNSFLWIEPYNLFITENTFAQLSSELQDAITQLNNQELLFNIYNATNPLTERAFGLAQYAHQTEAQDFPVGTQDNLSPESIRKRARRNLLGGAPHPTNYTDDNLETITFWETSNSFPPYVENMPTTGWENILNYKEQTLINFIAINNEAEGTPEIRARARMYAQEVLATKPVSYLAKKVISLTADLA